MDQISSYHVSLDETGLMTNIWMHVSRSRYLATKST